MHCQKLIHAFLTYALLTLGFGCAVLSSAVAADEKPQAATLSYEFRYNGILAAEVRDVLMPTADGGYRIDSHAEAKGLAKILYGDITRKSEGRLADGRLQLQQYWQQRGSKPVRQADYDAKTRRLRLQNGEEKREEIVEEGLPLLDYLTALYRPYVVGKVTAGKFAITDGWRLREYEYKVGAPETISTPAGAFEAVPLRRDSSRGERVFWLAPQLHYLPVKISVEDKGHAFETLLLEVVFGDEQSASE